MNPINEISTPTGSVQIWKENDFRLWCWATPNGSEGIEYKTFSQAKREALEAQNPRHTYTARNVYGIVGESKHRTPEAACRAASKRKGEGWIVEDESGKRWTMNGQEAVCID